MEGILTKEQEKQFANLLDEVIDFTKISSSVVWNFVEMFDGKLFEIGVGYLDDVLADKIPDEFKTISGQFVVACIEKDTNGIESYGTVLLNTLIDIPGLTEETEAIFFAGTLKGIIEAIMAFTKDA